MLTLPSLKFIPSPNYSSRNGSRVRLIVLHDCEGDYSGAISWFAQGRSQVSAHGVVREDGGEVTQMVRVANKAWHACNFNPVSEGWEMAGFSAKGFSDPLWDAGAAIIAYRLKMNGLPCRWAEKGIGEGFCSHFDLGPEGGGHRDPTTDPNIWQSFADRVGKAYAQPMPDSWPIAGRPLPPPMPPGFTPSNGGRSDETVGSVAWCQMRLNALHVTPVPLDVDGLDGNATERAIWLFQQTHGLHIDGVIGPKTIAALEAA